MPQPDNPKPSLVPVVKPSLEDLANSQNWELLRKFRAEVPPLSLGARRRIVEQALALLEQLYVHLPQKEALHAAEPIRRLRLLRFRLEREAPELELMAQQDEELLSGDPRTSALGFHDELQSIFAAVRDLHTAYSLPGLFTSGRSPRLALLGIDVEPCYERCHDQLRRRYVISRMAPRLRHDDFQPGVEAVAWNGVPIARAVALHARRHAGSNPAARHARGVTRLAIRPLTESPLPDEDHVTVTYLDRQSKERELRLDWYVGTLKPRLEPERDDDLGLDYEGEAVQQVRQMIPDLGTDETAPGEDPRGEEITVQGGELTDWRWRDVARAWRSQNLCYVRLYRFRRADGGAIDSDAFLDDFEHLLELKRWRGLVLDVRDNAGGSIPLAERLLQLISALPIEPERFQLRSTPATLKLCRLNSAGVASRRRGLDLSPWLDSLEQAQETGAVYSAGVPLTDLEKLHSRAQVYHGPVVLITNALSYSATDVFAAGFQDHGLGTVLGVDASTGAGGANVFDHARLLELFCGGPLEALPAGARLRLALRRSLRVRRQAGAVLEDLGVRPDKRYFMTCIDLLEHNRELIARAFQLLRAGTVRRLDAHPPAAVDGGGLEVVVQVENLERIHAFVDGRPLCAREVEKATVRIDGIPESASVLRLEGFAGSDAGEPAAVRQVELRASAR